MRRSISASLLVVVVLLTGTAHFGVRSSIAQPGLDRQSKPTERSSSGNRRKPSAKASAAKSSGPSKSGGPSKTGGPSKSGAAVKSESTAKSRTGSKTGSTANGKSDRRLPHGFTPEREAHVRTFVKRNHPELSVVLASLKSSSLRDYQAAVMDLFRTSERLTQLKLRQGDRYDLELQLWKSESRLQLLAARMTMTDDVSLQDQLEAQLEQQLEIRRKILLLERGRVQQRLDKLDEHLEKLERNRRPYVEQQMRRLTRKRPNPGSPAKTPVSTRPARRATPAARKGTAARKGPAARKGDE